MKRKNLSKFLPLGLAMVFLVLGVATLGDYGINWDEPVHFMRGQAYLRFFLTGKKNYDDLPKLKIHFTKNSRRVAKFSPDFEDDSQFRRSLYQSDSWNGEWFFKNDTPHPPLNDILAAFTNFIFYQKLGVLGDIEAYHLFEVLMAAVLVLVVAFWAKETYGVWAGLVAGLALALTPFFWAESHYNVKDPIEACFFTLTLYGFYKAVKKRSTRWLILTAIFFGLALATKLNIIFVLLIFLLWLLARGDLKKLPGSFWLVSFLAPLIVLAIFFLSWPYLWQKPIQGLVEVWQYYHSIGIESGTGFDFYPLKAIFFTTPLPTLFLGTLGVLTAVLLFKKEKEKTSFLWFLWFLVPIARVIVPGTVIYGGLRQIMEYLPAMALLAGLGAEKLRQRFKLPTIVFLLAFLPLVAKLVQLHPNEGLYFNSLIGGLRGAARRDFPNWGLSLGNEYRQGIKWLNEHAEKEANLALARGLLSNVPRIWIRPDINFGGYYFSGEEQKGEYIMALTHEDWERWIPQKAEYLKKLAPVYQLQVEGMTVLAIWKNDGKMLE